MTIRPFLVALGVLAVAFACDHSPTDLQTPAVLAARSRPPSAGGGKSNALVVCSQPYDSVTRVIGPVGGYFAVGPHYLFVDSLALTDTVSITAVTPADTVRWVRFQPDGLVFQTGGHGFPAVLYTSYKDCGLPTIDTLRIAQVTDSLSILGYLETYVKTKKNPWSQGDQYVAGVLHHFSNYAVAW